MNLTRHGQDVQHSQNCPCVAHARRDDWIEEVRELTHADQMTALEFLRLAPEPACWAMLTAHFRDVSSTFDPEKVCLQARRELDTTPSLFFQRSAVLVHIQLTTQLDLYDSAVRAVLYRQVPYVASLKELLMGI